MSMSRAHQLQRIQAVKRLQEQVAEVKQYAAQARLALARNTLSLATSARRQNELLLSSALQEGSCEELQLEVAVAMTASAQERRCLELSDLRAADAATSLQELQQATLNREKVDALLGSAIRQDAALEVRREQAESDDRFLSRRDWLRKQALMKLH